MAHTSLSTNKFAFAEQNPVLPNYRGDHQAFQSSKMLDNQTNLASSESQPNSLVHYPPITPTIHYYTGNSNEATINSFPTSTTTNMINSTNPSGIVQPVSLIHYQPITPAGSEDPIRSTDNTYSGGLEHTSTNNDSGHHTSNGNSHDGASHSGNAHKSSSSHNNNDHGGSHHSSSNHSTSHHHGAFASAGGGGASASAD